jgi:hypothetical protein
MTLDEWYLYGLEHGFCSMLTCQTHDGVPMTDDEELQWEDGFDPCLYVVRVWVEGSPAGG